ncbi:MAG: flagellar basal-body MS-ring/collar protein FliF [Campylobacterota bacterium]|nr:flagellar basal-body MS-ring/collar protein FliF [Campylobacterota bacterium]
MDFKALISQLVVLYSNLSKNQKIIIGAAIGGIVAFLVFLVLYTSKASSKDGYRVLFESLSPSDAALVIEQLEKDNITYRIPRDNVIEVPKDVVYKERIAMASLGIPKAKGAGFELFDKQEFGATQFDQNVKFLRALEGELVHSIDALAPVERSTVNLAMPKETLFVSKEVAPTAAVMVKLVPGRVLTNRQIRGIKNLVASAVTKLTPENVALVNDEGETLGGDDEFAQMGELSVIQQKFKTREESKLEKKIVNVLAPFIGGNERVVAKVTIDYDFSQRSSTSEKFDPENVVRSEQSLEEKREGSKPKEVGGVPGTVSNIGPVEGLESQQSSETYSKNTATTNYEVSKTVSTTKGEFATIKRMTAAVVVDGKYKTKLDEDGSPTDEMEYVALDETQMQAITALVQQSIGIDDGRGDLVSVRNFQFDVSSSAMAPRDSISKITQISERYLAPFAPVLKYLMVALILFIAYKKVIAPFGERMLEFSKEEDESKRPQLEIEDDEEEDLVEKVQQMRKKVEGQLGMDGTLNEDELKYDVLIEKVRHEVEERPEEIARLFEALILEESEGSESAAGGDRS